MNFGRRFWINALAASQGAMMVKPHFAGEYVWLRNIQLELVGLCRQSGLTVHLHENPAVNRPIE